MLILRQIVISLLRIFFNLYFLVFGKPKISGSLKKVLSFYETGGFGEFFSFIRVWGAPFEEIAGVVPKKGLIVDLGCGEGILTNYLAFLFPAQKYLGVDIDKKRISLADKGLPNASFKFGDVTKLAIPPCNGIILSHLLHHLESFEKQEKLIEKCYHNFKKNGVLVITEVDNKPFTKYLISTLTDYILVPILFNGKIYERAYFRKKEQWLILLQRVGFKVKVIEANRGKPFSHIIFKCTK